MGDRREQIRQVLHLGGNVLCGAARGTTSGTTCGLPTVTGSSLPLPAISLAFGVRSRRDTGVLNAGMLGFWLLGRGEWGGRGVEPLPCARFFLWPDSCPNLSSCLTSVCGLSIIYLYNLLAQL